MMSSDLSGERLAKLTFWKVVLIGNVSPPEEETWAATKRPWIFSWIYKRAPSVSTIGTVWPQKFLGQPSWVSWVNPVTRGGERTGRKSQASSTKAAMKMAPPLAARR